MGRVAVTLATNILAQALVILVVSGGAAILTSGNLQLAFWGAAIGAGLLVVGNFIRRLFEFRHEEFKILSATRTIHISEKGKKLTYTQTSKVRSRKISGLTRYRMWMQWTGQTRIQEHGAYRACHADLQVRHVDESRGYQVFEFEFGHRTFFRKQNLCLELSLNESELVYERILGFLPWGMYSPFAMAALTLTWDTDSAIPLDDIITRQYRSSLDHAVRGLAPLSKRSGSDLRKAEGTRSGVTWEFKPRSDRYYALEFRFSDDPPLPT